MRMDFDLRHDVGAVGIVWLAMAASAGALPALPIRPALPAPLAATAAADWQDPKPDAGPEESAGAQSRALQDRPMNRLSKESSPYLRLHQYNPVDWYPWGPEALALAKKRNQPIFLSIGYSACHWCHVMAKESFSDPAIAKLLNEKFVCIKVDREERPDIDEIYMAAVQAMGQQGGWPLSVWLTPDARPFFGGTYFPPEDVGQRRGFRRVCTALANAWENERDEVVGNAAALSKHLASALAPALQPGEPDQAMLDKLLLQATERFDQEHGGFAYPPQRAPKFPHSSELQVLLRIDDASARDMVVTTLHAMRRGGIHDQLGGGFHRYSTDRQWLVPHFEKMLYDNALLASCYLEAAQATGDERFAAVGRSTLDYMLRELQAPSGGFWSSQDAQSDGVEGKFFVWQLAEVQQLLGDDAKLFVDVFGLRVQGNWEGNNVLWLQNEEAATGAANQQQLRRSMTRLLAVREQRNKPSTDDKVLAAWNGLALTALADGHRMLGDARYLLAARRCAAFCLQELVVDGRVWRSFHGGKARHVGYLEDHAALANGLLSLFEVDSDPRWLQAARDLLAVTTKHFRAADGAFWYTADDHEDLLARTKSAVEGATPSGNAMAALAYLRAGLLLGDEATYQLGVSVLRAYHELLATSPAATPALLLAVQFHLGQPKEIVVAGEPDDVRTQALLEVAWRRFPPAGVVTCLYAANREALTKISSVFRDKLAVEGVPAAYVCERGTCLLPVTDAAKLLQVLAEKQ